MSDNTRDLSKFGYREIDLAADLLKLYSNSPPDFLSDGVAVEFNPNSGMVFLVDEDLNVGVIEDDKLMQFFSCPECGNEGTINDYPFDKYNGYCSKECEAQNE